MKSVGFKEWALVCNALGRGEQCVILRKGGIAERRSGFHFGHREFFLFPTFYHEQIEKVRAPTCSLPTPNDTVPIRFYAKVERALRFDSLPVAESLAPLHILSAEVVRERFEYESDGLNVAFVRVFELAQPWTLRNEKRFAGCRSWVDLPDPPPTQLRPVVDDVRHARQRKQFDLIVSAAPV